MKKTIEWMKEHKKALIGVGIAAGSTLLVVAGVKHFNASSKPFSISNDPAESLNNGLSFVEAMKNATEANETFCIDGNTVDCDIFTVVAPAIEQAVLCNDLPKVDLSRVYKSSDGTGRVVNIVVDNL